MGGRGGSSASAKRGGTASSDIGEHNFFMATAVNFESTTRPDREPDFVSDSGSEYWYTKDGVVRGANHWIDVASCQWFLDGRDGLGSDDYEFLSSKRYGKAKWSDFEPVSNDYEVTYYALGNSLPKTLGKPSSVNKDAIGHTYAEYKLKPSMLANGKIKIGDAEIPFRHYGEIKYKDGFFAYSFGNRKKYLEELKKRG